MRAAVLVAATLVGAPGAAVAAADWSDRSAATGSWGGLRTRLADAGVEVRASYTAGFWSNVHGGLEKGTDYEGFAHWGLDADLAPLLGWPGGTFHVDWISYHGGRPSVNRVGTLSSTAVSGWEGADSLRFFEIFLRQQLLRGRLAFEIGQLSADDDFFVVESSGALLNATFGYSALGREQQITAFYPLATPGIAVYVGPWRGWYARSGVYVADSGEDEWSNRGFDWSFEDGVSVHAELGTRRTPFGRPGTYGVGVVGTTADVFDFETGSRVDGGLGVYALVDQALLLGRDGGTRLGCFTRLQYGPNEDRDPFRWYVDAGLKWVGPLPGRDHDVLSAGVAWIRFSDAARAAGETRTRSQTLFELTYRVQLAGWLSLQPDLQIFADPPANGRDAVVVGLRAVVDL